MYLFPVFYAMANSKNCKGSSTFHQYDQCNKNNSYLVGNIKIYGLPNRHNIDLVPRQIL